MTASDYLELELLDHVFGNESYEAPANVSLSLHSADPGEDGSNELSGNGYARTVVANNTTNFPAGSTGTKKLAVKFYFSTASGGAWTTATYFGIWDATHAGNFLVGGALTTAKKVEDGDTPSFAANALEVTMN